MLLPEPPNLILREGIVHKIYHQIISKIYYLFQSGNFKIVYRKPISRLNLHANKTENSSPSRSSEFISEGEHQILDVGSDDHIMVADTAQTIEIENTECFGILGEIEPMDENVRLFVHYGNYCSNVL